MKYFPLLLALSPISCAGYAGPQTETAISAICEATSAPIPKGLDARDVEVLKAIKAGCAARDAYSDGGV